MADDLQIDEELVARLVPQIKERGAVLAQRIAAVASGPVQVVAVTKGHPVEAAIAAVQAGYPELGENYAQEMRAKAPLVPAADWHFVGRLQSNKVAMLAPDVSLWESLDRVSVLDAVARRSPGARVLVQVDLAAIPGRGGCERSATQSLVEHAVGLGLDVAGLMAVGGPGDPESAREGFRWLHREANALGLTEVSMGMSADLRVALEEGSTMVRIGTDLIGERPPR